jgi:hypothetical protein
MSDLVTTEEVEAISKEVMQLAFGEVKEHSEQVETLVNLALWKLQAEWCDKARDIHSHYAKVLSNTIKAICKTDE